MTYRTLEIAGTCLVTAIALASAPLPAVAADNALTDKSAHESTVASGALAIVKFGAPIKDSQSRIRYIVDLEEDESGKPDTFGDAHHKIAWHKARSGQLIENVTKLRDVELLGTTSLVGTSFTAYLTENQAEQFAKDKRVKLITQDAYVQPSALWSSNPPNPPPNYAGQVRPWGLYAMGVSGAGSSNGTATVYVLDTGVEVHNDLVLAAQLTALTNTTSSKPVNPIGCYAHATHVAGIIGAADNGTGVVGVLPGVRIVSVALGDQNDAPGSPCPAVPPNVQGGSHGSPVTAFVAGLEKIIEQVQINNKVGIVNISFNGQGLFSSTQTIGMKMRAVATPTFSYVPYKGALVVQSAGNQFSDACAYAYNAPHANDGIMVVGGLDDNGQPVVRFNGFVNSVEPGFGYISLPIGDNEPGSNTNAGGCVEVWAPSQRLKSTWTGHTVEFLSGTSMAAPHIAGFAARLVENDPSIVTSVDLEAAVRAKLTTIDGSYLQMPHLANIAQRAKPTIIFAEGVKRATETNSIGFNKNREDITLRYEAVGAASCEMTVYWNGWYWYTQQHLPATYNVQANQYTTPGDYTWSLTCTSPQGTQNTAVVTGRIKKKVTLVAWEVNTTSTGGEWWRLNQGDTVTWSADTNAPFWQRYMSEGADGCRIQTFGAFIGLGGNYTGAKLWDSDPNPNNPLNPDSAPYPPSHDFGTLFLGNPMTIPWMGGPYQGYMWRVYCWNSDRNEAMADMWGTNLN